MQIAANIFFWVGTVVTVILGALTLFVGSGRAEDGSLRKEAVPLVLGIVAGSFAVSIAASLNNRRADAEAERRHSQLLVNMFRDNQRISPSDIRVVIRYPGGEQGLPKFLNDDWITKLHVIPKYGKDPKGDGNLWSSFEWEKTAVHLQAGAHTLRPVQLYVEPSYWESQISVYADFFGALGELDDLAAWNESAVELDVAAPDRGAQLSAWFTEQGIRLDDPLAFAGEYGVDLDDVDRDNGSGHGDTGLRVTAEIFLGARSLGKMKGAILWRCNPSGDDFTALLKFNPFRVPANYFATPTISPGVGYYASDWGLAVLGGVLACASIGSAYMVVRDVFWR
jgi:hypothetical protein